VSGESTSSDRHFQTGLSGLLARFFVARRAAGDPFDATVVLPCLIFVSLARLNDLGRADFRFVAVGLILPACMAGLWIGSSLGVRGIGRSMLRGILVGAFEGAAIVGIAKEGIAQAEALKNAFNLMYINFVFFWFFSLIVGITSDILIQTEQEWQSTAWRRTLAHKIFRLTFGLDDIKGVSTAIGLTVWAIRILVPMVVLWEFGISPWSYLKNRIGNG